VDDIRHQLHRLGFGGGWDATPAADGSTGRAYVARQGDQALFIKVGPVHPAVERLSSLGLTPPILAHLEHDGDPFTVYQYFHESAVDRAWIGKHADALVDLLNVMQQDRTLTDLLESSSPIATIDEHLAARVERTSAPVRDYWWSAVNSVRVALWIDRHALDEGAAASFLADFFAAEGRCPNPKHIGP